MDPKQKIGSESEIFLQSRESIRTFSNVCSHEGTIVKQINLQQIATLIGGKLFGDGNLTIIDADIIRDAREGFLTFATKKDYFPKLDECQASAVLIPEDLIEDFQAVSSLSFVAVDKPQESFTKVVSLFRPAPPIAAPNISDAAHIDPTSTIGKEVTVEPGAVIGPNVVVADRCRIYSGAHLMSGTRIGEGSEIFPNSVLYENTVVGKRCRIHANCVIGCHGFGYDSTTGEHKLSSQLGNVEIGDDVDIGAGTSIDRATFGSTTIGDGTKIDNLVQIGHNCRIGKRNLICALVGIAGSCMTGDNVVLAGQVGIGDHVSIGDKAVLAAKTGVMADLAPNKFYAGIPAVPAKKQWTVVAASHRLPEMRKKLNAMERELQQLRRLVVSESIEEPVDDVCGESENEAA